MTSNQEKLAIEIDKATKEEAEKLYESLGMDLTTAINIFLKQSVREQRMPFTPSLNSEETSDEKKPEVTEDFKKYVEKL